MLAPPAARNYWPEDKCAKAFWSQQEIRPYRRLLRDTLLQVWDDPDVSERARDDLLNRLVAGRQRLTGGEADPVWSLDFRFKHLRLDNRSGKADGKAVTPLRNLHEHKTSTS